MWKEKIKVLELFGGIGAIRKALINLDLDYEIVDYVEFDRKTVDAYNALYEDHRKVIDVRDYVIGDETKIDLLFHGSPCQDFSVAGNNAGGELGSDTRSSLLWETIRIVKNAKHLPKIIIWENVKNVLSKKHKKVFDAYIEELDKLGYLTSYKVINAANCGIPQNRNRVFAVSIYKDYFSDFESISSFECNEKMLPLKSFLEDDKSISQSYFIRNSIPSMIKAILNNKIKVVEDKCLTILTKQWRWNNQGVIKVPLYNFQQENFVFNKENNLVKVNTITASGANSRQKLVVCVSDYETNNSDELAKFLIEGEQYYLRVITPLEALRLMGFSDSDYQKLNGFSKQQIYKMAGNSIVVKVLEKLVQHILKVNK